MLTNLYKYQHLASDTNTSMSLLSDTYNTLKDILSIVGVSDEEYLYASLGDEYDYLSVIKTLEITKNISYLKKFYKLYFDKIENKAIDNMSTTVKIDRFNYILRNFIKYDSLCISIVINNRDLTNEEKTNIKYLFSEENTEAFYIKNIDELNKVDAYLKDYIIDKFNQTNLNDLDSIKKMLLNILFDRNINTIKKYLDMYGYIKTFKLLEHHNRNNPNMTDSLEEALLFTTIMQDIYSIKDLSIAKELLNNVLSNIDFVIDSLKILRRYKEVIKSVYENDLRYNLTNLSNIKNYHKLLDIRTLVSTGVETIDFSDKQYLLLAHNISRGENIESLINGDGETGKIFISTTPISHRNQSYYWYTTGDIILATDEFPEGNYILSSTRNMSTNNYLKKYTTRVENIKDNRRQRGTLLSSEARSWNHSETFSFRTGLKFKYIILPGGRTPTQEEIKLAKKHNLKFIKTQGIRERILNPKPLEIDTKLPTVKKISDLENLKKVLQSQITTKKIGIITDIHGLYEPTLVALEEMRKKGITEIYCLGDVIGLGPNPSEVLNILKQYNVISLKGNHELYQELGINYYRSHFTSLSAYEEAKENVDFTKKSLSKEQLEEIKNWPEHLEINIGSKKILLCHSIYDYNTHKEKYNPNDYDYILQGHEHFSNQYQNIITVRGLGFGSNTYSNLTKSYYLELGLNQQNELYIHANQPEYDKYSLLHDINESILPIEDKEKLYRWLSETSTGKWRK